MGEKNFAILTGLQYDLEDYDRGFLVTEMDPKMPILYTTMTLHGLSSHTDDTRRR